MNIPIILILAATIVFGASVLALLVGAASGKKALFRVGCIMCALLVCCALLAAIVTPAVTYQTRSEPATATYHIAPSETIVESEGPEAIQGELKEFEWGDMATYERGTVVPELFWPGNAWSKDYEMKYESPVFTEGQFAAASLARAVASCIRDSIDDTDKQIVVFVVDETRNSDSDRMENLHATTMEQLANLLDSSRFTVTAEEPARENVA
ncbi:MAG: hypothetical protein KDB27_04340, partial [Planctomycetales bacterium]|nr:hypothetical protein [Planctomycetales bacterium]